MKRFETDTTQHRLAITDIEIEPNQAEEGEIGRSFWLENRPGRFGYQDNAAYIRLDLEAGKKEGGRLIEIEMTREEFLELMNYDESETDFSKINESLNPTREFVNSYFS